MASDARRNANHDTLKRAAATGTQAGKKTVFQNSVADTAVTSSRILLPHEDPAEWEAFRESMLASLCPYGDREMLAAITAIEHRWRMRRLARVETAMLAARMKAVAEADPTITDGDAALAQLFIDPAEQKRLNLLLRYMSAAERGYKKAMDELKLLQCFRMERQYQESRTVRRAAMAALPNEPDPLDPSFGIDDVDLALRL
jgi:hypothetical protein